jgi:hypothetical protein
MKTYTSTELATECNCAQITVLKWAQKNEVNYIGNGKRKIYIFTEEDLKKFKERDSTPGKKSGKH